MDVKTFLAGFEQTPACRGSGAVRKLVDESREKLLKAEQTGDEDVLVGALADFKGRLAEILGLSAPAAAPGAAEAEKRELSPEQADELIGKLKSRFGLPGNEELRKAVDFANVVNSLRADPEALFSLSKLEETGGEPQVVGMVGDEFIFEDRSAESPSGRRDLNFDEADAQRKSFGPNVRFQSPDSYKAMQKTGKFDLNSWSWLDTDPEKRKETGSAMYGYRPGGVVNVGEYDADHRYPVRGWRAALRVKKLKL